MYYNLMVHTVDLNKISSLAKWFQMKNSAGNDSLFQYQPACAIIHLDIPTGSRQPFYVNTT